MAAMVVSGKNGDGGNNISRQEIQAAINEAVELRALHAALIMQRNININNINSPTPITTNLGFLSTNSPSPLSRPSSHFSTHDYPVFTPSYEHEPLQGHGHIQMVSKTTPQNLDDINIGDLPYETNHIHGPVNLDHHICPVDDNGSVASSIQTSTKSRRRNSLGDFQSVSSCNKCNPATISTDNGDNESNRYSNIVMPLTDSHTSITSSQTKSRGINVSWLFPRFKRRQKNEIESEEVSQVLKDLGTDLGTLSIETLKKELIEANQKKEAALMEVSEMRSSFGELKMKLGQLESYCEDLKKSLKQATKENRKNGDNLMPVSEEVMNEGFLQIISEARLSVKQFCKLLVGQIEENDDQLMENLNLLLKPYKISFNSRYSKAAFYHLEAIINQAFYEDFENCMFQKNGTPKLLDPQKDRQAKFQSFVALRNLSWNEVIKKGTKYYSEEFSKFCDQKMSCIIMTLNWTRQWPEPLLQSFFVAAKCSWLLHLLAFSFYPPLMILRVEENRPFDPHYMEDMFNDKQKAQGPTRVKIMVMPGFYVQDRIVRCKVLCRYKSLA